MPAISVASSSRSGQRGSGGSDQVKVSGRWCCSSGSSPSGSARTWSSNASTRAGVDLERQVELERSAAGLLGVQVDLPRLAHGVGLDEVAFVVDVEAVIGGVVLEVGDEAGDIEAGHAYRLPAPGVRGRAGTLETVHDDELLLDLLDATADAVAGRAGRGPGRPARRRARPRASGPGSTASTWSPTTRRSACCERRVWGSCPRSRGWRTAATTWWSSSIPVDGSTNASRGIPWYATSLCAVDDGRAHGRRWW